MLQCTAQEYYKGDHQLPIYSSLSSGLPVHRLINIILNPDVAPEKTCSVQPLGVMQNAAFLIDIDIDDIRADDLGSWKATGNKELFSSNVIRGSEVSSNQTCWKCVYQLPTV